MTAGRVVAVACDAAHRFSKPIAMAIEIVAGTGVIGDAHQGITVKHRSRVAADPTQPNLRQVHLLHVELLGELAERGFALAPGELGENITTADIDLLALPQGSLLYLGDEVVLEITGLRNPCRQIEQFQSGLLAAVLDRAPDGTLIRKAGVMAVARTGGLVRAGGLIHIELPPLPHRPLQPV